MGENRALPRGRERGESLRLEEWVQECGDCRGRRVQAPPVAFAAALETLRRPSVLPVKAAPCGACNGRGKRLTPAGQALRAFVLEVLADPELR